MQYAADLEMMRERYARPVYKLVPLGSLTTLVQYGTSERSISDPVGVPVLRIPNLQAEGWDLSDLKHLISRPTSSRDPLVRLKRMSPFSNR